MKLVIDASVAVKWYIEENWNDEADQILTQNYTLIAPDFILVESANIFWKKVIKQELKQSEAHHNLELLTLSFDDYISSHNLYSQSLQLAFETNHSIYDMMYLSAAVQSNTMVVTADQKFLTPFKKPIIKIKSIG